jgi:hypothetical protein
MGGTVGHRSGPVEIALDIDRGSEWWGRPLNVQLLQTGTPMPTIVAQQQVVVPRDDEPVIRFDVPLDVENGRWAVLRVTDPSEEPDKRATGDYAAAGNAIAYAAPFFLGPDAPRPGRGKKKDKRPR